MTNCKPINIHSVPGAITSLTGISNDVTKTTRVISESNDAVYGSRFQPFIRVKIPIRPVITPAKHINPTVMAIPSLKNGQIKSRVRMTRQIAVNRAKQEAFFQGCNTVKNENTIPVKSIVIIGTLSPIPMISETRINKTAVNKRTIVVLRCSGSNREMK